MANMRKTITNRKEIWIQREDESNDLTISGDWGGGPGPNHFTKAEAYTIFECVREALHSKFPNLVVNPWADDEHGTLD